MYNITDKEFQKDYATVMDLLEGFFVGAGFVQVYCQGHLSIMASCEDPFTIAPFIFQGKNYPLPQTNQMNLEKILLTNPDIPGIFCLTTSYRNEQFPIPGRHDFSFPMFEFEHVGNYKNLNSLLLDLLMYLGFDIEKLWDFFYNDLCNKYEVKELKAEHEERMYKDLGNVMIHKFPQSTHPFWNMKQDGITKEGEKLYNKTDVILCGIETIGSAERSIDKEQMRDNFHTISNGEYANLLYHEFTKERVEEELEEYLSLPMFNRYGGGIGITRLIKALKTEKLI